MKYKAPVLTKEQHEWLTEKLEGLELIYTGFHGSHLYGLDREGSDIDIKAIYLPSKEQLILGKSRDTKNYKNDELDIEVEIKSLSSFLNSCQSSDTNCLDILHTPKEMIIKSTDTWESLVSVKESLYAKNMKGVVGYIKTHSKKYSNKINRLVEMKTLLVSLNNFNLDNDHIRDVGATVEDAGFKYISNVTLEDSGLSKPYLEVCGKKYDHDWKVKQLKEALDNSIKSYGNRSNKGAKSGVDSKSLSHALRVLLQLKQLAQEKTITFPLKDAEFVRKVKLGELTDLDIILTIVDELYDECVELLDESDLKENVDISPMFDIVMKVYFG